MIIINKRNIWVLNRNAMMSVTKIAMTNKKKYFSLEFENSLLFENYMKINNSSIRMSYITL